MSDDDASFHGDDDGEDDEISDDGDVEDEAPKAKRQKKNNNANEPARAFNVREFMDLEAEVSDDDEDGLNEVEFEEGA